MGLEHSHCHIVPGSGCSGLTDKKHAFWKFKHVDDTKKTTFVVVKNASEVPQDIRWRAGLQGRSLMSLNCLTSLANRGSVLKYKPFVAMNKNIVISLKFKKTYPNFTNIAESAAKVPYSKTKVVPVAKHDAVIRMAKARVAKGSGSEFVFLVTKSEKDAFTGLKNAGNVSRFESMICKLDPDN